jgi:hypothetical protein
VGPGSGGAKAPQGAAPAILGAWLVIPAAVVAEAVAEPAVRRLRPGQEIEVAPRQRDEFRGWRRLPAYHHQAPGNVVDAVTMLVLGHNALSVLQQANVIGQPQQMSERRGRAGHTAAPWRVSMSEAASSR